MRAWLIRGVVGLVSLGAAPAALAQVSKSSNWAGYAVHRAGVAFHNVTGTWREPTVSCQNNRETFSSYWVGLGGYSANSKALEQTGTEVDCTSKGKPRAFAWFELVPAPAHPIKLQVPPGDLIQGDVSVTGNTVTVVLRNLTSHTQFTKVLTTSPIDVSSAEWIVEAPSQCGSQCVTLPLADFGLAPFNFAVAQSTTGHSGSISDPFWNATEIVLVPHRSPSYLGGHRLGPTGDATPSVLQSSGSAFSVTYSRQGGSGARASRSGARATSNGARAARSNAPAAHSKARVGAALVHGAFRVR